MAEIEKKTIKYQNKGRVNQQIAKRDWNWEKGNKIVTRFCFIYAERRIEDG